MLVLAARRGLRMLESAFAIKSFHSKIKEVDEQPFFFFFFLEGKWIFLKDFCIIFHGRQALPGAGHRCGCFQW